MIGIRLFDIDGQTVGVLELSETTEPVFEETNPLFEEDGISGGFSAPGDIPMTQENMAILQNAHVLRKLDYITIYDCEVAKDNVPVYRGKLLLLESTNKSLQFSIAINGFNTSVLDKKLTDYVWPITTIYGPDDDTIDIVNYCSDLCKRVDYRDGFTFPVYINRLLYGEGTSTKNPHFEFNVNEWDADTQLLKYNTTEGAPTSEEEFIFNKYTLVPWFYIKWIIAKIGELEGYTFAGPALNSAEFNKLLLPNNYTLDKLSGLSYYVRAEAVTPNVFPTPLPTLPYTQALSFDDESTPPNEDNASRWSLSSRYTIAKPGYHYIHLYLKFMLTWSFVDDMLIRIKRSDGTIIHAESVSNNNNNPGGQPGGNWFDIDIDITHYESAADVGKYYSFDIIYNNIELLPGGQYDVVGYVQITNNSYRKLNVYSNVINPKNHLPDITVGDFINLLRDVYNLNLDFDRITKTILVSFAEKDLSEQPTVCNPGNIPELADSFNVPAEYTMRYKEATEYSFAWDFQEDATKDSFLEVVREKLLEAVEMYNDLESTHPNAAIGDICYVNMLQSYWIRRDDIAFGTVKWFFHSYAYQYYQTGDKPKEKKPVCSPMVTTVQRVPGEWFSRLITQVNEPGTSEAYETGINKPSVKLVYWHGRQYNNTGYLYPMATSGAYDSSGNIITTDEDGGVFEAVIPLEWELLFNAFWKSFYQMMKAPHEVEMQPFASMGFIRGLELKKPITINHITYVIKTLRYPLLNRPGNVPTTLIMARKMPTL